MSNRRTSTVFAAEFARFHAAETRINTRLVLVRLRVLSNRLQLYLERNGYDLTLATLPLLISENDHRDLLSVVYTGTGVRAAEREYLRLKPAAKSSAIGMQLKDKTPDENPDPFNLLGQFGGGPSVGFFSPQWRSKMMALLSSSESARRITGITTHTRQLVRDILVRGKEQGYSLRWAAKKIAGLLVGRGGRKRATLIARTETTRAANAGHEMGAVSTSLKLKKRWIATADSRTRDPHRAMIGKEPIEKDALFIVGGRRMKYPGDPAGGAANCVNCRCRVLFVPV